MLGCKTIWCLARTLYLGEIGAVMALVVAPLLLIWGYFSWKSEKKWKAKHIISVVLFLLGTVLSYGRTDWVVPFIPPVLFAILSITFLVLVAKKDKDSQYYKFLVKFTTTGIILLWGITAFIIYLLSQIFQFG